MYEQTQKIRELISKVIIRCILWQSGVLWDQLSSCLDVIGDTELAITAYLRRKFGESTEGLYLAVYGLLQALFVQQDAVINLCECLSIPEAINNYPRLEKIRGVRNDTIGHPTKRGTKNKPTYHFISRPTLTYDGFQHVSFDSNGKPDSEDVRISDLIGDQKTYLSEILNSVIIALEQREKTHKEKFKMEKLVSVFPSTLNYAFAKVSDLIKVSDGIIEGKYPSPLALMNFQEIKRTLQNFREAIAKRGITYDSINYVYELLEYPLAELDVFFQNAHEGKELNINEKTASIFVFFVE